MACFFLDAPKTDTRKTVIIVYKFCLRCYVSLPRLNPYPNILPAAPCLCVRRGKPTSLQHCPPWHHARVVKSRVRSLQKHPCTDLRRGKPTSLLPCPSRQPNCALKIVHCELKFPASTHTTSHDFLLCTVALCIIAQFNFALITAHVVCFLERNIQDPSYFGNITWQ